jgi:diguanylate cyclase (GGDEF)-like protein
MTSHPLHVVIAAPDKAAAKLSQLLAGDRYRVSRAATAVEALEMTTKLVVDVAVLDLSLPEALSWARSAAPRVPVVALAPDEAAGQAAVQAGVQDYLLTAELGGPLLERALRYAVDNHRLNVELTLLDPLTGLYNLRAFMVVAEYYLKLARRLQHSLVLTYVDIDNLAAINRDHGYAEGNWALQRVAGLLRSSFRESDILARLGDDEFVFFALGSSDRDAEALARRLTESLSSQLSEEAHAQVILSAGVVWYNPESTATLEELMAQAEAALHEQQKKKSGG